MQKTRRRLYADIILILALLIVALSAFILWRILGEPGRWAVVYHNGEEICRYSLNDNGEYTLNEGSNTLVIENGKAYMKRADCPDKKCVNMGKKSISGESIICLPNKIEVRIEGGEEILVSFIAPISNSRIGVFAEELIV